MWQHVKLKKGQVNLWRRKNNTIFVLLAVVFIFICIRIPVYAGVKTLEGEKCTPSSSSFSEPDMVSSENETVYVGYFLSGGIQNSYNHDTYPAFSGDYKLFKPYRFGYRFVGWYADPGFRKKVESIPTDQKDHYILYAKWTVKINNIRNVENYDYKTTGTQFEKNHALLKDLDYSFLKEIDIPGMPDTKEDDFLNQYIFSESQCPQGLCLTDEFVLITSYSAEDDCMGELMVFDRESGKYMVTLGLDENSHLGGIAFDGENVWVCNSYENCVERISYDFIELMAYQNTGEVVDARDVVDTFPVKNTPSCITWYGGRLWIATHTLMVKSRMYAYYLDKSKDKLVSLSDYQIPPKIQGVAFDDSGRVYLSSSYGRNNSSYLYCYDSVTALATHPKRPQIKVEMPPGSEELDVSDDILYLIFETAGEKYLEGTDGKGKSLFPLDKILMIPVTELGSGGSWK